MSSTINATKRRSGAISATDWAQLLLLGFLWGGAFFLGRIAVLELHPLMLVLLRVAIAAGALHLYLLVRGPSFRSALPMMPAFFVLATLNNVIPFSLIFTGQTELGAGLASIINATTPFWTAIAAAFLTSDEKLSWNKVAGITAGIIGTAIMIGPSALAGLGGPAWAKFAVLGAALSYALAAIYAKRFRGVPVSTVATGQLTASTTVMLPIVLLGTTTSDLLSVSLDIWLAVVTLGLACTAFAYILYFRLVASAGATNASLVTIIVPASAITLGVIFLGERFTGFELTGLTLILVGLMIIDGRVFTKR